MGRKLAVGALVGLTLIGLWLLETSGILTIRGEEVTIDAGDVTLAGTLALPRRGEGPFPAAVIVHGSGPVTRRDLRAWARRLVPHGMAVLIYDKRGTGESGGRYSSISVAGSEAALTRLADDAAAALATLRGRDDIDASRIGYVGGSQAGWIMPLAAERGTEPAFIVTISGAAVPYGVEIHYSRLTGDDPPPPVDDGFGRRVPDDEVDERLAAFEGPMGFDPLPVLRRLDVPHLWLLGGRDRSVPTALSAENLRGLGVDVRIYPEGDHSLRDADTGRRIDYWSEVREWLRERGILGRVAAGGGAAAAEGTAADPVTEIARIVEEHFLDPDLGGLDWAAETARARAAWRAAGTPADRAAAINGWLGRLGTSHTRYYPASTAEYFQLLDVFSAAQAEWIAERFPGDRRVRYAGIGLVTERVDGRHHVTGTIHGTPAADADIRLGDAVLTVDGEPFVPFGSFFAKPGRTVRIELQSTPDPASRRTVDVRVEALSPGTMYLEAIEASARVETRDDVHIGYVRVWSYAGEHYHRAVERLVRVGALAEADALVLDIRGGWGGASPDYLNLFNDDVPRLSSRGRDGEWRPWDTQWRRPVVLLVDGGSRSGKEILAAGFKTYRIGPVVGSRTAGAVVAGRSFRLSNDDLLYVAVSDVRVDGVRLEGRGVEPDIAVDDPPPWANGVDAQRERAIDEAARLVRDAREASPAAARAR